jgi:hypothetical protein
MDASFIAIIAIVILAAPYFLLPLALRAFNGHGSRKIVKCPESGELAEVELNALCADSPSRKAFFEVRECSLWTERMGCSQTCLKTGKR